MLKIVTNHHQKRQFSFFPGKQGHQAFLSPNNCVCLCVVFKSTYIFVRNSFYTFIILKNVRYNENNILCTYSDGSLTSTAGLPDIPGHCTIGSHQSLLIPLHPSHPRVQKDFNSLKINCHSSLLLSLHPSHSSVQKDFNRFSKLSLVTSVITASFTSQNIERF